MENYKLKYVEKLKDKLHIYGGKKSLEFIDYNFFKLDQSIKFFLMKELKNVSKNKIINLFIDFETCIRNKRNHKYTKYCNGKLSIYNKDDRDEEAWINISCKNIKYESENESKYKNNLKSLFQVILHELYHYLNFLNEYNKSGRIIGPEEFNREMYGNKSGMIGEPYNYCHEYSYISYLVNEEEINADEFSFRNLNYFENLYYYDSLLPGVDIDCIKGENAKDGYKIE